MPLKLGIMWGVVDLSTLAWPCVGIHHGLESHGGKWDERDGGGRSDVAAAVHHIVMQFG